MWSTGHPALFAITLALTTVSCAGARGEPLPGVSQQAGPEIAPASTRAPDAAVAEADAGPSEHELEDFEQTDAAIQALARESSGGAAPSGSPGGARRPLTGPSGLRFGVVERGPGKRWLLALLNQGDTPVRVVADPRLLWFEVAVPARRTKKTTCRLPGELFPSRVEHRVEVVLEPGQAVADSFDPRLYCFAAGGQTALVPGALIEPHFGWPAKEKPKPAKRKAALAQAPPFVATPATVIEGPNARVPSQDELCDDPEAGCVKELTGESFALRSEYKAWSSARLEADQKLRDDPGPVELELTQGSDAAAERNATVTLKLKNRTERPLAVYFRRELVSFEVVGPDGALTCDPEPDLRSPDRQAFERLRKGGSIAVVSRLVELCPSGTLARPGIYLVHARFDATQRGDDFDLDAFVGRVVSLSPAAVRVRTGELPFLRPRPIRPVSVAGD
jgi:hypothetical protein